jgi:hypothetical protein
VYGALISEISVEPVAARSVVPEGRISRLLLIIAIVAAEADEALYIFVIVNQGSDRPADVLTVPFVASFIQLMAVFLGVSMLTSPNLIRFRPALRAGAAAGLLVLGVFGAFSIGAPLFVAGVVAAGVAVRTLSLTPGWNSIVSALVAAAVVVALLVTGFEVTARVIECPTNGSSGGNWPGIVTRGFSWECTGGQVHFQS